MNTKLFVAGSGLLAILGYFALSVDSVSDEGQPSSSMDSARQTVAVTMLQATIDSSANSESRPKTAIENQHPVRPEQNNLGSELPAGWDFAAMSKILESRRDKALLTPQERAEQQQIVNSEAFQREVYSSLRASDVTDFAFDEEKRRMAMQIHLGNIARFGHAKSQSKLKAELTALIMSTSYADKSDLKLKKSLVGDKIEYLRFVKRYFPELFQAISAKIESADNEVLDYVLAKV